MQLGGDTLHVLPQRWDLVPLWGFLFGKDESVPHVDVADAPSRIHQNRYKELSAFCYHNVELHAYPAIAFVSHSFAYRAAIMTSPISIAVEVR